MLLSLTIKNFVIIDELELRFSTHLNIITGETGAGKSILMGALGLILGERAQSTNIPADGKKCIVEATFSHPEDERTRLLFSENDWEESAEIILRREISSAGKSRCFINDSPANLSQMRLLGDCLVDLHQQFDTEDLENTAFQLSVLDALAESGKLAQTVKLEFERWMQLQQTLNTVKVSTEKVLQELDYHRFLFNELDALKLYPDELEQLDSELNVLNNAEQIKRDLAEVSSVLQDGDVPVLQQLKVVQHKLHKLVGFHPELSALNDRVSSTVIELNDIANDLSLIADKVAFNPERIQWINDRLNEGYRLQKKHGVHDTAGLLAKQEELESLLQEVQHNSDYLEQLERETAIAYKVAISRAEELSVLRRKQIVSIEKNVNKLLKQVGMPNAGIKVEISKGELQESGIDKVAFLFNANIPSDNSAQVKYEPLNKVASGGERSRLMMCIKSMVAKKLHMPTLIFDEIDSGISGEAAIQVGRIMKELSSSHQVISITHQPQVAAKADAHYFVYKVMKGVKVQTLVKQLDYMGRIEAIARMLGGENPTAAALENAREMVEGL